MLHSGPRPSSFLFFSLFFFNDTATTEIYTLSLHDALPICDLYPTLKLKWSEGVNNYMVYATGNRPVGDYSPSRLANIDRKSTRLNSSHPSISYAVFCLKKKKKKNKKYNTHQKTTTTQ